MVPVRYGKEYKNCSRTVRILREQSVILAISANTLREHLVHERVRELFANFLVNAEHCICELSRTDEKSQSASHIEQFIDFR